MKPLGIIVLIALAIGAAGAAAQSGGSYNYPPPGGPPGGPGGGGGGGGARPTLSLSVKANKPRPVLRRGILVRARCNVACVVQVRAAKGSRRFGGRTKRFPRGSGRMYVKLNKKGKKAVRRAGRRSRALRFKVTGAATDASNRRSSPTRAKARVKKPAGKRRRG